MTRKITVSLTRNEWATVLSATGNWNDTIHRDCCGTRYAKRHDKAIREVERKIFDKLREAKP